MQRWQMFLIYIGFCLNAFLVNAFWNAILSVLNKFACKKPFQSMSSTTMLC